MNVSKLVATSFAIAALTVPAVSHAADPKPGEFKIPGTDTTLKLNGNVRIDATYDFSGADDDIRGDDWATFLEFQPLDKDERSFTKKNFYLTPRTSRIGLTTNTPTSMGDLAVRLEGDFNSPSPFNYSTEATTNGNTFRVRHAYGTVGGLLVGQTWSNFLDLGSLPDTVDFNPHGAFALTRGVMIRYALPVGPGNLSLAIENPQTITGGAAYPASVTVGRFYDRYPDVNASFTMPFSFGHVNLRGIVLDYRGINAGGVSDEKWGWGAGASGSVKLGGADTFVWSVQGGDGIGRYMFQTLFQGAAFVGDSIETWKAIAYHAALTHSFSPTVRANIGATQTFIEPNADLTAAGVFGASSLVNKRVDAAFVNAFFSPFKNTELGVEYFWGQRIVAGTGDKGTQHRVNAAITYNFF